MVVPHFVLNWMIGRRLSTPQKYNHIDKISQFDNFADTLPLIEAGLAALSYTHCQNFGSCFRRDGSNQDHWLGATAGLPSSVSFACTAGQASSGTRQSALLHVLNNNQIDKTSQYDQL